jgi:enoyl-CoA hydratase/carnithine racemase
MSDLVHLTNHDGVGVIRVENPPVNALSSTVLNLLESCLLARQKDPAMQAPVLIGGGRTFIAGADINEFLEVLAGRRALADQSRISSGPLGASSFMGEGFVERPRL